MPTPSTFERPLQSISGDRYALSPSSPPVAARTDAPGGEQGPLVLRPRGGQDRQLGPRARPAAGNYAYFQDDVRHLQRHTAEAGGGFGDGGGERCIVVAWCTPDGVHERRPHRSPTTRSRTMSSIRATAAARGRRPRTGRICRSRSYTHRSLPAGSYIYRVRARSSCMTCTSCASDCVAATTPPTPPVSSSRDMTIERATAAGGVIGDGAGAPRTEGSSGSRGAAPLGSEGGFALIGALLVMVLVTALGSAALFLAQMDLMLAGNYRVQRTAEASADGALDLVKAMIFSNAPQLNPAVEHPHRRRARPGEPVRTRTATHRRRRHLHRPGHRRDVYDQVQAGGQHQLQQRREPTRTTRSCATARTTTTRAPRRTIGKQPVYTVTFTRQQDRRQGRGRPDLDDRLQHAGGPVLRGHGPHAEVCSGPPRSRSR